MKNNNDNTDTPRSPEWHEIPFLPVFMWPAYILVATICLLTLFLASAWRIPIYIQDFFYVLSHY